MTDPSRHKGNPDKSHAGLRVLLVDDEHQVLRVLERVLRRFDTTAVDRAELAESLLESESFDVVICDNSMPGKSGVDFLRTVAARHPCVHRVMHTGSVPQQLSELQRDGVIELFVPKPGWNALADFCDALCVDDS